MPPGRHKVEATVHTIVLNVAAIEAALVGEILTKLFIDILRTDAPAVLTIDCLAESGRIDYGETQTHATLLNVHGLLLDTRRLLDALLDIGHLAILVEIAKKEAIDERRFAQARFTHHHQSELETTLHRLAMHLLRQRGKANVIPILVERRCLCCKQKKKRGNELENAFRRARAACGMNCCITPFYPTTHSFLATRRDEFALSGSSICSLAQNKQIVGPLSSSANKQGHFSEESREASS